MIIFLFKQMVHGMGIMWLVLVFPSNTIISMKLPDSATIFTAEIWTIIKTLEEKKKIVASKYIVFTDSLSCLQDLQSMKQEYPLIQMVIRKCVFLKFDNKGRKWFFLFNDALNTFYLRLYGVRHMVKYHR